MKINSDSYLSLQQDSIRESGRPQNSRSFYKETPIKTEFLTKVIHLKCEDTHFLIDMEFPRPVEVEDGVEWSGMTIKEVFIVREAVVSDQRQDVSVSLHRAQAAQAGVGVLNKDSKGISELLYQLY